MFGVIGDRIGHRDLLAMMRATYAVLAATLMTLALTGYLSPLYVFVIATVPAGRHPGGRMQRR